MRFLVDACAGPNVALWLKSQNHEVFSVYDQAKELDDNAIIDKAFNEKWILITLDKDFGEKVFRDKKLHQGVILLRLDDERPVIKIEVLNKLINIFGDKLKNLFVVSTEKKVRTVKK